MRRIDGLSRVDVIYRRVDDPVYYPRDIQSDSGAWRSKGLMRADGRKGTCRPANTRRLALCDDKVSTLVEPGAIKYYLDQDPLRPRTVPHYLCHVRVTTASYVLEKKKQPSTSPGV